VQLGPSSAPTAHGAAYLHSKGHKIRRFHPEESKCQQQGNHLQESQQWKGPQAAIECPATLTTSSFTITILHHHPIQITLQRAMSSILQGQASMKLYSSEHVQGPLQPG